MLKQQDGPHVCVHTSNPRLLSAARVVMHLQRQSEPAKHPKASFFFLEFAFYKEKAGVCVFLYKRACGALIEALGSLDTACSQWRYQRIHTRKFPHVLISLPEEQGKRRQYQASLNICSGEVLSKH